jgi:hypothetical protein
MSSRIEDTDALALLRELPPGWAQTCLAYPTRQHSRNILAVLGEARRVLRSDGTLWLLLAPGEQSTLHALAEQGWTQQPTPRWAAPLSTPALSVARLHLLSKTARYFYDAPRRAPRPPASSYLAIRRPARRAGFCCVPGDAYLRVLRRCILAGSSPLACGTCGAPYQRERDLQRHASCVHRNPGGRCLVLDPFARPTLPVSATAEALGRSYLAAISLPAGARA